MKIVCSSLHINRTNQKNPQILMSIHSLPFHNLKMQTIMRNHKTHALWRKWWFVVFVKSLLFLPPKHSVDIVFVKSVSLNIFWFLVIAPSVRLPFEIRNTTRTKPSTISLKAMLIVWGRVRSRNMREGKKKPKITKHKKSKMNLTQFINHWARGVHRY